MCSQSGTNRAEFFRLGREFIWVGLGQGAAALGGLIGVRLLTGFLSPTTYGELGLGMTFVTLIQSIFWGPIVSSALRYYSPALEVKELSAFLKSLYTLSFQLALGVFLIGLLLIVILPSILHTGWSFLFLTALMFSILDGFGAVLCSLQNAARHRVVVALHQSLAQWLRFLFAVGIISSLGKSSLYAMVGYSLAAVVTLTLQLCLLNDKIFPIAKLFLPEQDSNIVQWQKKIRNYAWPFAFWGVFLWVQQASDRWSLQVFRSTEEVGLYVALYQLGYYPIQMFIDTLIQLITPVLFSKAGDGSDVSRMKHVGKLNLFLVFGILFFTVGVALFCSLFHKQIFALLLDSRFHQTSYLLPFAVCASGIFAAGQAGVLTVLSKANTRILIPPKVGTALVSILTNALGAYLWGIKGIVGSSLFISMLYFVWIMAISVKMMRN